MTKQTEIKKALILYSPYDADTVQIEFQEDTEFKIGDRLIMKHFPDYIALYIERKETDGKED